jgi:hypothetical protein
MSMLFTARWLDEKIDLGRVYGEIWKDAAPAHLVDVAVFCDSDDTHTLGPLVAANASRPARS